MANALEQQYLNLNNWVKNMTSFPVFENTYADGVNTLNYQGGGGYERIYIPIAVEQYNNYTFKFCFHSPTGFSMGNYGHDAAFAFVRTSAPSDTGEALSRTNLAVSENWDKSASETPKEYTIQFNSGNYTTLYVAFDFGYILDGVMAQFVFSNFVLYDERGNPSDVVIVDTGLRWLCRDDYLLQSTSSMATINDRKYYKVNSTPAICFIRKPPNGYVCPALISTDASAVSYYADSGGPWGYTTQFKYLGLTWYYFKGQHGWQNPTINSSYAYYDFSSWEDDWEAEILQVLSDALVSLTFERFYLVRDANDKIYTITDGTLTALTETEVTSSLFQTYGVDELPDSALLLGLTDPEILCWQDSTDDLPTLTASVTGTSPVPQVVITDAQNMSDPTILGIESVTVEASEDVLWAISFDDGATWKAYDGANWAVLEQENSGMTSETLQNISVESWAAVVTGDHYRIRFVLIGTASYVASLTIHYLNEEVS